MRTGKYVIALIGFAAWIGYFDEHNIIQHLEDKKRLEQLKEQQVFLKNKIKSDKQKLEELQTSKETLEKFAREQFQMKKPNEEVFLIVEEK
jgi:cell division protein FtsB